tara:strand:- start:95 stop:394 length:300 start_codon:yes stop_codon:yes gene_type:complete
MDYINIPLRIKDAIHSDINESQWKLFTLYIGGYSTKYFQIYVYLDKSNSTVYMKPYHAYYDYEFEQLFNFGINCKNYDENKIIQVTQQNYHLNFEKYFE